MAWSNRQPHQCDVRRCRSADAPRFVLEVPFFWKCHSSGSAKAAIDVTANLAAWLGPSGIRNSLRSNSLLTGKFAILGVRTGRQAAVAHRSTLGCKPPSRNHSASGVPWRVSCSGPGPRQCSGSGAYVGWPNDAHYQFWRLHTRWIRPDRAASPSRHPYPAIGRRLETCQITHFGNFHGLSRQSRASSRSDNFKAGIAMTVG